MTLRLADETAIVTGSSQGIGKVIAERFAAEGANVVVNSRSIKRARVAVDRIEAKGGTALAVEADVSDRMAVQRLVDETIERFGRIDILVNNAGVFSAVPFLDLDVDEWQHVVDVNLTSVFHCAQSVGRRMVTQGDGGQIINVSSVFGSVGVQGRAAYNAAKGGVNNLTRALAVDLAHYDIQVNALAPGYVRTEAVDDALKAVDERDGPAWPTYTNTERAIRNRTPLDRLGEPEEIAKCALFLAEGGHYVTGEILHADGGWLAFGWGSKGC